MNKHHKSIFFSPPVVTSGATLVQTTGLVTVVNNVTGSATITNAFPSNVTAGNFIVFALSYKNVSGTAGPTAVTVGGSSGVVAATQADSFDSHFGITIYYVQSAAGGTRNISITFFDSSGGYITGSAEEWSGMAASALDQVPAGISGGGTSRTITSSATSVPRELVYSCACDLNNNDSLAGPTSGYTQTALSIATQPTFAGGYKTVSSTGTQSATFTNAANGSFDTIMATFKAT